ncbi:hypothetical protein Vadar_006921 [Vaccinium darrowii]|uniref:Uncharacterized protein n=1 Tax=Vaccinium darrowii TaxID=229202 RepID=A0ACB7YUL2_9ERIC|nr:hypothetical protein Vadar_006921 [Vaccinium darrowii]
MYYDGADDSQLYELRCKATHIKQGGRLVPVYFAELKAIWQELDKRCPISMACPVDIKACQDEIMKDRIYDFLAGLDDVFDKLKGERTTRRPGVAAIVATGITPSVDSSHKSVVSHCSPSYQNTSPIYHISLEDSNSATSNLGKALISSNDRDPASRVLKIRGTTDDKCKKIWLWHRRLGHASFGYFRRLLPSLFQDVKDSEFKCNGETHVEIEGPDWFEVILEDVPPETVSMAETETGLSPVLKDVSDPPDTLERLSATPDIVIADSVDDSPSRDSIVPAHAPMDIPEESNLDINISSNPKAIEKSYQLPPRQNRGHPPNRFSPEGKAKYSIARYVSSHRLTPQYQAFVNQMAAYHVESIVITDKGKPFLSLSQEDKSDERKYHEFKEEERKSFDIRSGQWVICDCDHLFV